MNKHVILLNMLNGWYVINALLKGPILIIVLLDIEQK